MSLRYFPGFGPTRPSLQNVFDGMHGNFGNESGQKLAVQCIIDHTVIHCTRRGLARSFPARIRSSCRQ